MAAIFQTRFPMRFVETSIKTLLKFVPKGLINYIPALFR